MDIVTYPMPPDVAYFLDSALEHGELDAGSHVALNLYAPRGDLMRIVDRDYKHDGQPSMAPRLSICGDLTAYAGRIIDRLSPSKRGAIALAGLQHIKGEVQSLAWCMATWAIEDEIKGSVGAIRLRNTSGGDGYYPILFFFTCHIIFFKSPPYSDF